MEDGKPEATYEVVSDTQKQAGKARIPRQNQGANIQQGRQLRGEIGRAFPLVSPSCHPGSARLGLWKLHGPERLAPADGRSWKGAQGGERGASASPE